MVMFIFCFRPEVSSFFFKDLFQKIKIDKAEI